MNLHQNLKIGFKDLGYGWFVLELPSSCPLSSWFNLNLRIQIWTSDVRSESWTNFRMLFVNQSKILTPVRQAAKIKEKSSVVMAWHKFESYNAGNQRTEQVLSLVVAASSVNVSKYLSSLQGITFKNIRFVRKLIEDDIIIFRSYFIYSKTNGAKEWNQNKEDAKRLFRELNFENVETFLAEQAIFSQHVKSGRYYDGGSVVMLPAYGRRMPFYGRRLRQRHGMSTRCLNY